jgi:two-component system LytT family response regulator
MPEMNGFELLEKLTWRNFNLVFTTAHREHAVKALKHNAVDYLLKPVDHEDLQAAINKIAGKIASGEAENKFNFSTLLGALNPAGRHKMIINSKSGIESININEIIYLESRSNYTHIHLLNSRLILTSKTLKEFEDYLCVTNCSFMRIHNSFIINLNKVLRYLKAEECVVLNDEQKVPISKSKKDAFYTWLNI